MRLDTTDLGVAPSQDKLLTGVDFIQRHGQLNQSVYVHCKAGRARSTTVVVCYLMKVRDQYYTFKNKLTVN